MMRVRGDLWQPFPRQVEALDAMYEYPYVLYGGSAGPGKSHWLRWAAVEYLLHLAGLGIKHARVGLFCEDYPTLRDRQISRITREFPAWLGSMHETRDDGLGFFLKPQYGSGFISLRNLDDPAKYASTEFAAEFVDELTKNDRQTFDDLRFRLRWPGVQHTPFVAASNPGSVGHGWVKKLFVDGDFTGEDSVFVADGRENPFKFIRALPKDNPYLATSYWEQLDTLPERMRRALRDGDWNIFEGQAFAEWRDDLHVVEPFTIPDDWTRWVAIDYGYAAPFCALWFARSPDKTKVFIYRELYEKGWRARRQAKEIKARSNEDGGVEMYIGDPSMWQKNREHSGESFADEYLREGVKLVKANNNRMAGMAVVREALAWREYPGTQRIAKEPRIQVFRTCHNLIRTLPALPFDKIRVEDIDTEAEDHGYDTMRYGLMAEAGPRQTKATKTRLQAFHAGRKQADDTPKAVKRWMKIAD